MVNKTMPKFVIKLFFIIGLISGLSIRLLAIVNRFDVKLGRYLWYQAVIGYIFFFGYRMYISKKRIKAVKENDLINKLKRNNLNEEDKENIVYLLESLVKSKEIFNYIFIFVLSIVAIMVDITLEIIF